MRISDWSSDVCSSDLVGAFHQRQIAVRGSTQQRVEVGAGMIGDAHRPSSGPFAKVRASQPFVSVHAMVEPSARSTTWAPPPNAMMRGLEQVFAHSKPQRPVSANASAHRLTKVRTCPGRSDEHTSELQSLMRISYAVFCLKKKKQTEE